MPVATSPAGVPIAYDLAGDGPALVLLHGITENRRTWDPLVPDLATDHAVLAVDVRGHGESGDADAYDAASMAADAAGVAAGLGLVDPLVVGHSMGGVAATAYAAAHPCRGVVNVDQSIALGDLQDLVRGAEPLLRSDAFGEVIGSLFDSMHGPLPADEVARVSALRRPSRDVVLGAWAPLLDLSRADLDALVASLAGAVRVPYLSLHGIDPGADYGPWLAAVIPTSTVEVWDDHGHYPHLVDPERFVARVRLFESTLG